MNPETLEAIKAMNDLPDISGDDSPELKRLCEQSTREVGLVGSVSAATSLEMVGFMRELEIRHRALITDHEQLRAEYERVVEGAAEEVAGRCPRARGRLLP